MEAADSQLNTPLAFLVFNRPEVTARVFRAIAAARPRTLLVVADGPRPDRPGEAERCDQVRRIATAVDWPCDLRTNFAPVNLGCGKRVSSGLNWVFELVPEAIILEDDCLPHPTFFRYCQEMLAHFRGDPRIAMISGDNFQFGQRRGRASYYFSRYAHIWGWASWKRAWQNYDVNMDDWPSLKQRGWLHELLKCDWLAVHYTSVFDQVSSGEIDTWDVQWLFSCWKAGALTALPQRNLVSNIGVAQDATHRITSLLADLPVRPMNFPLVHSPVERNAAADAFTENSQIRPGRIHRLPARALRFLHGSGIYG